MGLTKQEKWARNKKSFDQIIGDPYAFPDAIIGHYTELKSSSVIRIVDPDKQPVALNSSRPTAVDFFCDVDAAIEDGLATLQTRYPGRIELFSMFMNTYFYEVDPMFNQQDRNEIEQIVGNILRKRKISPIGRYFTSIRK